MLNKYYVLNQHEIIKKHKRKLLENKIQSVNVRQYLLITNYNQ